VVSLQIGVLDDGHVETGKLETDILGWMYVKTCDAESVN